MVILITSLVAFHAEGTDQRHVDYKEVLGLVSTAAGLYINNFVFRVQLVLL